MGGPISGCDPHLQQAHQQQAQSKTQIIFLQQPNAFLNQQLASQVASHIQHLQQSILPKQPSPAFQTLDQPQSSTAPVTDAASTKQVEPTVPTFNSDEMVKKLKEDLKEDILNTVRHLHTQQVQEVTNPPPTVNPPIPFPTPQPTQPPPVLCPSMA